MMVDRDPFHMDPGLDWFWEIFNLVHEFYKSNALGWSEYDTNDIAYYVDEISYIVREVYGGLPGLGVLVRELAEMAAELRTNLPRELYYTMQRPKFALRGFSGRGRI
jgi:hypothetical protein